MNNPQENFRYAQRNFHYAQVMRSFMDADVTGQKAMKNKVKKLVRIPYYLDAQSWWQLSVMCGVLGIKESRDELD
jgi:hypothetical protein